MGDEKIFQQVLENVHLFDLDVLCEHCGKSLTLMLQKEEMSRGWLKCSCMVTAYTFDKAHQLVASIEVD